MPLLYQLNNIAFLSPIKEVLLDFSSSNTSIEFGANEIGFELTLKH